MKKKIFKLTLGLLMFAASVWAQSQSGAQSQAGTQSQGGIKLPPMHQETLDNGLLVMIVQHQELPVVAFRMMVKSGGMSDPSGKAGLANFAADLLRQGTKTKSATEISEEIDFVGGSLSAGADYDYLSVNCQVLKKYFDTGLNLVSDVILNPAFDKTEIERLRSRRIGEIQQSHDNPSAVASDKFREFLFGTNPLANPLEGTQKSVKGITRKD
ncbi:MAG: insulinase family protein, partial [candidate division Zixibacteria bacterium]|nr:insulinase family protein [candidate division Zixibacteria bacterium]